MAITKDTAALVAAQLTVAWATLKGPQKPDPARPFEGQVAAVYGRFREAVAEKDITKPFDMRAIIGHDAPPPSADPEQK